MCKDLEWRIKRNKIIIEIKTKRYIIIQIINRWGKKKNENANEDYNNIYNDGSIENIDFEEKV